MVMKVAYVFNSDAVNDVKTMTHAGNLFRDAMNKCDRAVQTKYFQWRFGGETPEMTTHKACDTYEMHNLIERLRSDGCGYTLLPKDDNGWHCGLVINPVHQTLCDKYIEGLDDYEYSINR